MKKVLFLCLLVMAFVATALMPAVYAVSAPRGHMEATGNAPGGKKVADPDNNQPGNNAGAINIVSVTVNGVLKTKNVHYTTPKNCLKDATVVFVTGHVPAAGESVVIVGETSNVGTFAVNIDWRS